MAATDSGHSKNSIVNIKPIQINDRPMVFLRIFTLIFYNVRKNDMYQCKQWIQISSIRDYKGYTEVFIFKFSGYASGPSLCAPR